MLNPPTGGATKVPATALPVYIRMNGAPKQRIPSPKGSAAIRVGDWITMHKAAAGVPDVVSVAVLAARVALPVAERFAPAGFTEFAQPFEITGRRDQHTRRSGHGLDDDRGNLVGAMPLHDAREVIGKIGAVLRLAARKRIA